MRLFYFFLFVLISLSALNQNKEIVFPLKHTSTISSLVYSESKRFIATSSNDWTIKLWNVNNNLLMRTFIGHKGPVNCLEISKNTEFIVSGSNDSTVIIWNIHNGIMLTKPIHLGGRVLSISIHPENKIIIAGTDNGKVVQINSQDGKIENEISFEGNRITKTSFQKDKNRFIISLFKIPDFNEAKNPGSLILMDIRYFDKPLAISNYKENIGSFNFSPDSSRIITAASNGMVRVWESEKYIEEISFKNANLIPGIVFMSRNNKMVGVSSQKDNLVNIWRITGEKLFDFTIDQGKTIYAEFNEDITRIHICSDYGKFLIYDLNARERDKIGDYMDSYSPVTSFTTSDIFNRITLGFKNGVIKSFDLKNSLPLKLNIPSSTAVLSLKYSTDEKKLFVSNDQTVLFNENTNETSIGDSYISFIETPTGQKSKGLILKNEYCTHLTNYDNYCIAGFNTGIIKFLDITTGKTLNTIQCHDYDILDIKVVNDKKWLVTSSIDATVKIWDINGTNLTFFKEFIFSNDITKIALCSFNNNMLLYSKNEGLKFIFNLNKESIQNMPVLNDVTGIELSNTDSLFFVSYKSDVTECDAISSNNGSTVWKFKKPGANIIGIAYSSKYNALFCCRSDGSVIILNPESGKEILTLILIENEDWLAFTPEFKFDGSIKTTFYINLIDDLTFTDNSDKEKYHITGLINSIFEKK